MVEHQLPKLVTRVRFPPGAPNIKISPVFARLFCFLAFELVANNIIFNVSAKDSLG